MADRHLMDEMLRPIQILVAKLLVCGVEVQSHLEAPQGKANLTNTWPNINMYLYQGSGSGSARIWNYLVSRIQMQIHYDRLHKCLKNLKFKI